MKWVRRTDGSVLPRRKPQTGAILSTTNPKRTCMGSLPNLNSGRLATYRLGHNTDQQGFATSRFEWPQNRSISNMLHARELQNALCKQYASLTTTSGSSTGAICHNRDSALNTNKTRVAHRDSIQQAFTVFYLDRTQGRLKMRWLCNKTFLESRCIATASLYRDC
jgi:hypothetical protein